MRATLRAVGTKAAWAAVAALALALLTARAEAVTLRYKFKPGESHSYRETTRSRSVVTAAGEPAPRRSEQTDEIVTQRSVLSVSADGTSAEIEMLVKAGKTVFREKGQTNITEAPKTRTRWSVNDRGEIQAVKASSKWSRGKESNEVMRAAQAFPESDLKVNDVWDISSSIKMPDGQTLKVKARSRLVKLLTYKGRPCAQIRTVFESPFDLGEQPTAPGVQGHGKVSGEIIWFFDYVRGWKIGESGTVRILIKGSGSVEGQTQEFSISDVGKYTSVMQHP